MNNNGDVVGYFQVTSGTRAFVYKDGVQQDLNTLIAPGSGWELAMANGINTSGQIVGWGYFHNKYSAFLLTPGVLPALYLASPANGSTFAEPATLVLTADSPGGELFGRYEFYQNGIKIADSSLETRTINGLGAGSYAFKAIAYDWLNNPVSSQTVSVTVTPNSSPVVTAVTANPNPVDGLSAALSAAATDDDGETSLTYTWEQLFDAAAGTITFSANGTHGAATTTATFSKAGIYRVRVVAKDPVNFTGANTLTVAVVQTPTGISLSPVEKTVEAGASIQFAATVRDQFGMPLQNTCLLYTSPSPRD